MRIGRFDVRIFSDGVFRIDGGAMFGVVPKVLWEQKKKPDDRNRVSMDMNCLLVRDADQDPDELIWQCLKIGYEHIAGQLDGGIAAWRSAGLSLTRNDTVRADELDIGALLDIRQSGEYAAGHIPGAVHRELGTVADAAATLPPGPLAVMCGHGERAATAASVLERAGRPGAAIVLGGPPDWAAATGRPLDDRA